MATVRLFSLPYIFISFYLCRGGNPAKIAKRTSLLSNGFAIWG